MSGQWKNGCLRQLYTQPAPDSGSVDHDPIWPCLVCISVLLTCPGTLCRHIDEVQSTWRQCRGKGCPGLSASWAETMERKKNKQIGISGTTDFSCSSTRRAKLNVAKTVFSNEAEWEISNLI